MAPKTKDATTAASLRQGTLSFASSKRGASATNLGKANAKPSISASSTKTKAPQSKSKAPGSRRVSQDSARSVSVQSVPSSVSSSASDVEEGRAAKRVKVASVAAGPGKVHGAGTGNQHKALHDDSSSEDEEILPREDLAKLEASGRLSRVYGLAKNRMGWLPPVHAEKQTKVHEILRIWDNSFEYGPCVGVTRLERWERAQALGLNPPTEIRDILMTEQAVKEDGYKQSVFYGEV